LIVALGAHGACAALAKSLAAWIRHRRPSVDIEVTGADGRRVRIAARDADIDVAALVRDVVGSRQEYSKTIAACDPTVVQSPRCACLTRAGHAP
jgi:hypothetical protein